MSIIHDALKKVQQGQVSNTNETPASPPAPASSAEYVYTKPSEPAQEDQLPVEYLQAPKNKTKSLLALLCVIALTFGCLFFSYKQLHPYFYKLEDSAKASLYKFILKKKSPENPPLASIVVSPAKPVNEPKAPSPITAPVPVITIVATPASTPVAPKPLLPTNMPAISIPFINAPAPQTLNIHGVMANASGNLVLINDQVYQEGDEVAGVKIVKIDLDYITVLDNGKEEEIRVKS